MARARQALAEAIVQLLEEHGNNGKRLSLRQAERITGLSPATIGELAKGNARTPESIRRFARGMNSDAARLLILAGFVPETEEAKEYSSNGNPLPYEIFETDDIPAEAEMEPDEREWLGRYGRALAKMPSGRERDLWKESLRRNTELLEAFLNHVSNDTTLMDK